MTPILPCMRRRLPGATAAAPKNPAISTRLVLCLFLLAGVLLAACEKDDACASCPPGDNQPPVAKAGADQAIVLPQDSVLLDGSASADPDGRIVRYAWRRISGPAAPTIRRPDAEKTSVAALSEGVYLFELQVTDDKNASARDTVQVVVTRGSGGNQPPVANAGPDRVITLPANLVVLDGTASSDPDGSIVSWQWQKVEGPQSLSLSAGHTAQATAKELAAGVYRFELTVTDNGGLQDKDTMQITVHPAPVSTVPACDNSNRPQVAVRLTPVGTLSQTRGGMAVAAAGNKVVFAGGATPSAYSSRVDLYDISTNTWSTAELSQARYIITAVTAGNKIILGGGEISDGTWPVKTVDIYDVSTNTWTSSSLSVAGHSMAAAAAGTKVLFAGGDGGFTGAGRESTVDIYDLTSNTWSTASLNEPKRGGHAAVAANNKVYVAGGGIFDASTNTWYPSARIDVYDAATNTWSTATLQEGKSSMGAVSAGGKIYWAGGWTSVGGAGTTSYASCMVEIMDPGSGTSSCAALFRPSDWLNAVVKDNKILFYRPYENDDNKFDIYDMATGSWSIGVFPFTVGASSIIALDNNVFIAGGLINGVFSNQVWKLEF